MNSFGAPHPLFFTLHFVFLLSLQNNQNINMRYKNNLNIIKIFSCIIKITKIINT